MVRAPKPWPRLCTTRPPTCAHAQEAAHGPPVCLSQPHQATLPTRPANCAQVGISPGLPTALGHTAHSGHASHAPKLCARHYTPRPRMARMPRTRTRSGTLFVPTSSSDPAHEACKLRASARFTRSDNRTGTHSTPRAQASHADSARLSSARPADWGVRRATAGGCGATDGD